MRSCARHGAHEQRHRTFVLRRTFLASLAFITLAIVVFAWPVK